jgi:tRNA(Ile)-lysidine synthase TilS/MesJ
LQLEEQFPNFTVVHPFLLTKKEDFKQFIQRNGWSGWIVEDETNSVVKGSRRNWLRCDIIPMMQKQRLSLEKYAKRRISSQIEKEAK